MNPLSQVKLRFTGERNPQKPGARNFRVGDMTTTKTIDRLIESLNAVLRFYRNNTRVTKNMMVDIRYNDIIAKSNRVRELLKPLGNSTNETVVGVRFSVAVEGEENHIITHYVDEETIKKTIDELKIAKFFLNDRLGGMATKNNFDEPNSGIDYEGYKLSKTKLRDIIIDCSVVESFDIPHISVIPDKDNILITFYKSELSLSLLLEKLRIDDTRFPYTEYGDDTISVSKELFVIINQKIPYMISMISTDLSTITIDKIIQKKSQRSIEIPMPENEPIIGVIDTLFDESVYFNKFIVFNIVNFFLSIKFIIRCPIFFFSQILNMIFN